METGTYYAVDYSASQFGSAVSLYKRVGCSWNEPAADAQFFNPALNNRDDVVFVAFIVSGGGGPYLASGGTVNLLIPNAFSGARFFNSSNTPAINDSGAIAFEAMGDDLGFGIWVYASGQGARIARAGDASVSPFRAVSRPMLNNQGTVAFIANQGPEMSIQAFVDASVRRVVEPGDAIFGSTVRTIQATGAQGRFLDESGTIVFAYQLADGQMGVALAKPALAAPPEISPNSVANGATYLAGGLVLGSWAQLKGTNLAPVTRIWQSSDFQGLGNSLPTRVHGVEVKVGGKSAPVYFVSPTQITFQVPDVPPGPVTIQVIRNGVASAMATSTAAAHSPGIFPIVVGTKAYAAGVFLDGKITGDPTIASSFRKARPGNVVQMFATGLQATPGGGISTSQLVPGVTVKLGDVTVNADVAASLVSWNSIRLPGAVQPV